MLLFHQILLGVVCVSVPTRNLGYVVVICVLRLGFLTEILNCRFKIVFLIFVIRLNSLAPWNVSGCFDQASGYHIREVLHVLSPV